MKNVSYSCARWLLVAASCAGIAAAQSQGAGAPEVIQHRVNPQGMGSVTKGSTGIVTPAITYHGGALIPTPGIYLIWYGNWNQANGSDNPGGQQILRDFTYGLNNSAYFNINTTYTAGSYTITGSTMVGGEATDAYSQGTRLRDSSILAIVSRAITTGKLAYDPSGVYFVLTSSDVNETSGFCTKYCGWHTAGNISTGQHVRYSFVGNANRCLNACAAQSVGPNGNAGVDGMLSVVAHELEEATTDADPRSGWVDSNGAENADKCAWTFGQSLSTAANGASYNMTLPTALGSTRNYLVQRNLKHATSGDTCNMTMTAQ